MKLLTEQFEYPELLQETQANGKRKYKVPSGERLPSVTTILGATGDKSGLVAWREWVGDKEADRIVKEAVALGSLMHTHLENYIAGEDRPKGSNLVRLMAKKMADEIINQGLSKVDEVWGIEKALYMPGLYAGTADLIGVYNGKPALMDFKSAKKIKKEEHIQDYYSQLCAYALAHNELFGTNIASGVIFMCDRNYKYKAYVIEGDVFKKHCDNWFARLDDFYSKEF